MSNPASDAVPQDLAQLDLGVLDELATLQAELEQVDGRLKSMEGRREAVAEEVYNRVRRDYLSQRQSLQEKADPLRQQVRSLYTKVKAVLIELEGELSTVQMDLEEIEFRHTLGEYDAAERDRRKKAKGSALQQRQAALDEAKAISARFAKAFPGVESEAAEAPRAPTPPASESEDPTKRVKKVVEDEIRTAELPSPEESAKAPVASAAAEPPAPPAPPAAPPPRRNPDATVVFRPARLIDQATDQPSGPYTLGLKPLSLGSDARCDVQVDGVAARQAEVGPSRSGFILRDLAGGGTRVNGQRVEEQLLADGDVIQIGSLSLKFSQI